MFIQNDVVADFVVWANKNLLEKKDKVRVKFNEYEEEGNLFSKIRFVKSKPRATILLSNRIPYTKVPEYLSYELARYLTYKRNGYTYPSEEELDKDEIVSVFESISRDWNCYLDEKYEHENRGHQ